MKKLFFLLTGLILVSVINAQSLDEIVKKHSTAIKADQLAKVKSIKITGKMTGMGMEMPMTMYMKNPNKVKLVYNLKGQEMVSVFDGEKGYMINPLTGSSNPVELTGEQLKQVQNNNVFRNEIINYYNKKQLSLDGEESVNGNPAYKLKVTVEGSSPIYMYIDKGSNLLVKTTTTISQMGQQMSVDSYMSDYSDESGVVMPKKTKAMANGMEAAVITFDKVEVNIPMEDSFFKVK
jgi:hypothetical protein